MTSIIMLAVYIKAGKSLTRLRPPKQLAIYKAPANCYSEQACDLLLLKAASQPHIMAAAIHLLLLVPLVCLLLQTLPVDSDVPACPATKEKLTIKTVCCMIVYNCSCVYIGFIIPDQT